MTASHFDGLLHEARRLTGRILACGRLHRVRRVRVDDTALMLKSRRLGSGIAIRVGNIYLRRQRSNVEVLVDDEWLRWELAVESATSHEIVFQTHPSPYEKFGGLVSRVCSGRPLQNILIDRASSLDEQFAAIRWAMAALDQLHQHQADWGNGLHQSISHGDATANNVIIDSRTQSASWIDFDTRHHRQLPTADRRADDLRALIYSVASHLPQSHYPRLAQEFSAQRPEATVVNRFRCHLESDWRRLNTFQLAQAPLSWKNSAALSHVLLKSLSEA